MLAYINDQVAAATIAEPNKQPPILDVDVFLKTLTLLDAIGILHDAIISITKQTIINCWNHCGINSLKLLCGVNAVNLPDPARVLIEHAAIAVADIVPDNLLSPVDLSDTELNDSILQCESEEEYLRTYLDTTHAASVGECEYEDPEDIERRILKELNNFNLKVACLVDSRNEAGDYDMHPIYHTRFIYVNISFCWNYRTTVRILKTITTNTLISYVEYDLMLPSS